MQTEVEDKMLALSGNLYLLTAFVVPQPTRVTIKRLIKLVIYYCFRVGTVVALKILLTFAVSVASGKGVFPN
jgi:hypothetical protein